MGTGLGQGRVQGLGQEERRLQVQVQDLVPAALGELIEVRTPGGAGVVDQDVEPVLQRQETPDEGLDPVVGREVLGQGDAVGAQLCGGFVALKRLARGDVDL